VECANLLLAAGDVQAAVGLLMRAHDLAPAATGVCARLAQVVSEGGEHEQAHRFLESGIAAGGDRDGALLLQTAHLAQRAGHAATAVRIAEELSQRFPLNAGFRLEQAGFLLAAGEVDLGYRLLRALQGAHGVSESRRLLLLSRAAEARGDIAEAGRAIEDAVRLDPANLELRLWRNTLSIRTLHPALMRSAWRDVLTLQRATGMLRGEPLNESQGLTGQILNEIAVAPELLSAIAATRAAPPRKGLDQLCDLVISNPAHVAPAIECCNLVLNDNVPQIQAAPQSAECYSLRHTIMQYWDAAELPAGLAAMMASWQSIPGYSYVRFDREFAHDFMAQRFGARAGRAFRLARQPEQQADLLRLAWLYAHGGIYADADDVHVGGLDVLTAAGASLVIYREPLGTISNTFIIATQSHPVIGWALEHALRSVLALEADSIWLATGPGLMTRALAQHLARQCRAGNPRPDDGILCLTQARMAKFVAMHCPAPHKRSSRSWRGSQGARADIDLDWIDSEDGQAAASLPVALARSR
jgi:tetratricopeptide (TPR) repeat protein